jgi:hypothetical protein
VWCVCVWGGGAAVCVCVTWVCRCVHARCTTEHHLLLGHHHTGTPQCTCKRLWLVGHRITSLSMIWDGLSCSVQHAGAGGRVGGEGGQGTLVGCRMCFSNRVCPHDVLLTDGMCSRLLCTVFDGVGWCRYAAVDGGMCVSLVCPCGYGWFDCGSMLG